MSATSRKYFAARMSVLCAPAVLLSAFVSAQAATPAGHRTISAAPPAIDATCKVVFDAADKLLSVPHHEYMTQKDSGGKTRSTEIIAIDGARYLMLDGKWSKSRMTAAQLKEQEEENKKNAKVIACKKVGDDTVNGEAAAVYTEHSETEDSKDDAKIWISKSKGLILKQEMVIDSGDHWDIRFEYANVRAPM
jgi:hypothetical protein